MSNDGSSSSSSSSTSNNHISRQVLSTKHSKVLKIIK